MKSDRDGRLLVLVCAWDSDVCYRMLKCHVVSLTGCTRSTDRNRTSHPSTTHYKFGRVIFCVRAQARLLAHPKSEQKGESDSSNTEKGIGRLGAGRRNPKLKVMLYPIFYMYATLVALLPCYGEGSSPLSPASSGQHPLPQRPNTPPSIIIWHDEVVPCLSSFPETG